MEHTDISDYYVADSYKSLETIGSIFEKDGKTYINVVLKSGKVKAVRAYLQKQDKEVTAKTNHIIYDLRSELGFSPAGFVYAIRPDNDERLNGLAHFDPRLGAYLRCDENIYDVPLGNQFQIKRIYWSDICDDSIVHLLPNSREIVDSKFS